MCGIAGIVRKDSDGPDLTMPIERMRHAVEHRGPDSTGTWQSPARQAAFAHTRLSIQDLSAGCQPMMVAEGRYTITYNGEIYNVAELRRGLEQHGVVFRTRSDTEVILRAYQQHGIGCVEQLRGMFAFALWDERERTCLFARDRFGIKPLYYYSTGSQLVFASEIRALLTSGLVPRAVDPQGMYGYFRSGSVPEPRTLLQDVRCLEAGHTLVWHDGQVQSRRYWDLRFAERTVLADAAHATREVLIDSVAHHFVSDVPVGIFLSGGIDSTALVALSSAGRRGELRTFSITFPGSANDEGPTARRTADHFGTVHGEWPLTAAEGQSLFVGFLAAMDQPSIDGFNTFAVSQFARAGGMKVVLSGLGADELFGGYPSFRTVPRLARWAGRLRAVPPAGAALQGVFKRYGGPRLRRVGDLLAETPTLATAYSTFRGIYSRAEARALTRHYAKSHDVDPDEGVDSAPDPTAEDVVSRLELTRYMRNQLLRDGDVMSMASGLELRVPFLDSAVVETVTAIASRERLEPGKSLLLRAVPEVPAWVVGQPKRGFQFPFREWFEGEWRETFSSLDRTCPVPMGTWYRKWCVYVLERWLENLHSEVRS